jgi:prepilin peptidase CpaA
MIAQYATFVMAALLIVAMAIEFRTGRIPNWLTLLPLALFVLVLILADDRAALYWQLLIAACAFGLGILLFIVGGMGAGAVKLLAGTVLFVPYNNAFYALLVFLVVFFVSSLFFVQIRKAFGSDDSKWHLMAKPVIPLSFSVGVAGLAGMFWF